MKTTQRVDEDRICGLEARIDSLESRLARLEKSGRKIEAVEDEETDWIEPSAVGAEYWIGARLLPRLGAVLIVLAIAFIAISETSKSPSVDRWALLLVEALFCLGFVAVGEWKRDELEGFGRTLTAIGACGLYLTAAGGHFAYHTLSAAGMAYVFAFLALLNHAYAIWRNTRLFFFIGATGGLVAMLFPLGEKDYGTSTAIYIIATAAAATVCATRRWQLLALIGWISGIGILIPVMDSEYSREAVLASLYAGSLACVAAYVRAHDGKPFGLRAIGAAVALFITGFVGFCIQSGPAGVTHLVLLTAAGAAIGRGFFWNNSAGRSLVVGSAATASLFLPLCLDAFYSVLAFVVVAIVAAILSTRLLPILTSIFSATSFVAATAAYTRWAVRGYGEGEALLLTGLLAGIAAVAVSLKKADVHWQGFAIGAFWVWLVRVATIYSGESGGSSSFSLVTIASVVYALTLLLVGFRLKSGTLRLWSVAVMLVSVFQILVLEQSTAIVFRLAALLLLGTIMLVGGYRYAHERLSA